MSKGTGKIKLAKMLNPKAPIYYDGRPPLTHDEISALILFQGHGRLTCEKIMEINSHKQKNKSYWNRIFKSLIFKEFIEKAENTRPVEYELLNVWSIHQTGPDFFLNYTPHKWGWSGRRNQK